MRELLEKLATMELDNLKKIDDLSKLLGFLNIYINKDWQLLSISFDPGFDTPEILKKYSKVFSADLKKWSFATGKTSIIDEMISRFGIIVRRPKASVTDWDHNLRTVIVDSDGIIKTIYVGNMWTSETLVQDIKKTANKDLIRN